MAQRLKNPPPKNKGGRKPTYPWDRWLDGGSWKLVTGKDFGCTPVTMEKLIRRTAARRNYPVSVQHTEDGIVVTKRIAA